jgi:LIVCS family branched-chain amino acid:cation transporter
MDLLAAFFFSSIICSQIKRDLQSNGEQGIRPLLMKTLKAICIGAALLGITYVGFSLLASFHSAQLDAAHPDEWLGALGVLVLGPQAGFIISMIVALSCLTTAIALAAVCGEFVSERLFRKRISYPVSIMIVLLFAFGMSTLGFVKIVEVLASILQYGYPALLLLTLFNIAYRSKLLWASKRLEN